jgi:molecular chaperone GrpE (heat shock protein)
MPILKYVLRDERLKVPRNAPMERQMDGVWNSMNNIFKYLTELEKELTHRFAESSKSDLTVAEKRKQDTENNKEEQKIKNLESELAILKRNYMELNKKFDELSKKLPNDSKRSVQMNPIIEKR